MHLDELGPESTDIWCVVCVRACVFVYWCWTILNRIDSRMFPLWLF
jgi:hypothetical protein